MKVREGRPPLPPLAPKRLAAGTEGRVVARGLGRDVAIDPALIPRVPNLREEPAGQFLVPTKLTLTHHPGHSRRVSRLTAAYPWSLAVRLRQGADDRGWWLAWQVTCCACGRPIRCQRGDLKDWSAIYPTWPCAVST